MGKTETLLTIVIFNLFFILFIVAIIVFIKQYKIKKKEHTIMLHSQIEEHQKELLFTQLEMQQQTMQHIGREIHDNIGQKLTLASLYTQQLAFENKAPLIHDSIESISEIINSSLAELRQLSKSLTDNTIESETIATLLKTECKKMNQLKKCTFSSNREANKILISYQTKSVLVRVVQEFLQNSIKHADCKEITVSLRKNNEILELCLQDDGKGFDINKTASKGIGLGNMKKRTEIIGGTYDMQSNSNGTKLRIEILL